MARKNHPTRTTQTRKPRHTTRPHNRFSMALVS